MSDSSQAPAVSVLMAVFNGQMYLREAVESVLAQTFGDFEFIVIDDGSTDDTLKLLEEFAAKDSRLRVVSRPNKGLTLTLNEGLDLARAQFLARMDADDISLPMRFEKQVAYLQEHPDCVLVGSAVTMIDPDGSPIRALCSERTHEQIDEAHLKCGWPVVHPVVMMRTAAVRKIGGYRNQYNTLEDLDLFLRLAEVGKLANLPDILLKYRQHFSSVTHRKYEQQMALRQAIFDETVQRRGMLHRPEAPPPRNKLRQRHELHNYWGWQALRAGHISTARKHAWKTIRLAPWSSHSWRLLVCSLRGY